MSLLHTQWLIIIKEPNTNRLISLMINVSQNVTDSNNEKTREILVWNSLFDRAFIMQMHNKCQVTILHVSGLKDHPTTMAVTSLLWCHSHSSKVHCILKSIIFHIKHYFYMHWPPNMIFTHFKPIWEIWGKNSKKMSFNFSGNGTQSNEHQIVWNLAQY